MQVIDYEELTQALAKMRPGQRLYQIIKSEMKKRGRWKNKPRGRIVVENLKRDRQ